MDKAKLEELKGIAEQDCNSLFQQVNDLQVQLERRRGDFRTYESLLLDWDKQSGEVQEAEIVPPEETKNGKAKEQPK